MSKPQTITKEYFVKRLVDLCVKSGLTDFPKDDTDQQILLKSAILTLRQPGPFTEKEISEKLDYWVKEVGGIKVFDRVTLRRYLIDAGYLTRSSDGSSYMIARPGPRPELFDPAVEAIDPAAATNAAREEIARRKAEYLAKAKK